MLNYGLAFSDPLCLKCQNRTDTYTDGYGQKFTFRMQGAGVPRDDMLCTTFLTRPHYGYFFFKYCPTKKNV